MFGPYERWVTEAYRAFYVDIASFAEQIRRWTPVAKRVLEVGCGEGAVTERLRAAYPDAEITGIDITPRVGRLYRGSLDGVRFVQCSVQEIAKTEPGLYDLVVLSDVLHHVPIPVRKDLLNAIRTTLAPGGALVFKEWERNFTPVHWLCHASDRWLTGDHVSYMTRVEMREQLARSFGGAALVAEARIAPWRNNIATLVRP
jgi:2-polyprenyl-3-methyl-5-hydroxy-6-metoxy-1,4-benzoquinol methylase